MTTPEFRIEKLRCPVSVVLTGSSRIDGHVFLSSRARYRTTPEEPLDLLNDDAPYFPLVTADGVTIFIAKQQVSLVEADIPASEDPLDGAGVGISVEVTLADGTARQGFLFPEVSRERPRILDFLNSYTPAFLPLFAAGRMHILNRHQIARVRALS